MTSPRNRFFNRRTLLMSTPILAAGLWSQRPQASRASQIELTGDCSVEPALQYVYDFSTSNFMALPLQRMGSLDPGPDWVIARSPELGVLLVPPDWIVVNGWANSFDRDGIPEWSGTQPQYPFWATTLVASPDETVAYMYVTGSVDQVELTPADGAQIARNVMMGVERRNRSLCLAEQVDPQYDMQLGHWISGDRYGSDLLFTRGSTIISSVSGANLGPGTTFLFDGFVVPRAEAEDLVLDVYLKILYQLLPKGGATDPTPTPSPTP